MITLLKRLIRAFLWDEAAAQRWLVGALTGVGSLLSSGGVIPGTETAIPHLAGLSWLGPLVNIAAVSLAAGGTLPSAKDVEKP